ncbi:hypothetical protein SUGI_0538590 [Cryptomeria japonica]|uniref:uncharacterized protein LOC131040699 n=1 Tax=Cryptomeria japonica TaxID=3369 RepID=UPI002408EE76|nr:uncharacterized protein LOC131040699 [Cryptomeria japonica]GLJ27433.1 hypothetical protein SUGI_0538590 [Cryptomeria japonica]
MNKFNSTNHSIERVSDRNGSSVIFPVLPKSIAQFKYLRCLDISGTKQTNLPKEICELHCLEELYLRNCSLEALPEDFGKLIKLKSLDISNDFLEFSPSFQRLKSLVNLKMAWNEQLVLFPVLPESFIALNARGCSKLQAISLESDMKFLKTMDLSHCENLTALSTLIRCKSLRDIKLHECKQLDKLDPLPECLSSVRIYKWSKLQNILINIKFDER